MGVYIWQEYNRVPWANTIAYYPLTSTTTVNDESWNSLNMTNASMTFGINGGVNCWNSRNGYIYRNDLIFSWTWNFTINLYAYREVSWITWENLIFMGDSGGYNSLWMLVHNGKLGTAWWNNDHDSSYTVNLGEWHNFVLTRSGTTWTLYVDGTSVDTWTVWFNPTSWKTSIGTWQWFSGYRPWFISEVILEDKARTEQEIADYYNWTKWNYI